MLVLASFNMSERTHHITVHNAQLQELTHSVVLVNGHAATYDTARRTFVYTGSTGETIELSVQCEGYEPFLEQQVLVNSGQYSVSLLKKGDHYYYDATGWKRAYPARSNRLIAYVRNSGAGTWKEQLSRTIKELHPLLDELGLEIVHDYSGANDNPPYGYSAQNNQLLLRKKNDSAFADSNEVCLEKLRASTLVTYAGPLVMHSENYNEAYTYGHKVNARLRSGILTYDGADSLAASMHAVYDHKTQQMIFPSSIGFGIMHEMEKMFRSDLFGAIELDLHAAEVSD